MMTLKIWYHCDSFSIRPLDELIEGGRWLGLPPFSSWRSGWRFTVLARFFSGERGSGYWRHFRAASHGWRLLKSSVA
jgi:hypothetical protein